MTDHHREGAPRAAKEDRHEHEDVRQMHAAMIGIVHDDDVALMQIALEFRQHRRHRLGDRAEMLGDGLGLRHHETNAQVAVESDANTNYSLSEIKPGTYSAAPLNLDNSHKYRLRIKTTDGKEYLSDFLAVKNTPPIDSVGFKAQTDGVHIYVNAHDDASATRYYRWEYSEDWEFHSWYESFWTGYRPRTKEEYRYNCYASDTTAAIIVANSTKLTKDVIYQAPIAAIPSYSEKIETKYSILVKQYSLTADAYNFWANLQKNTGRLGSIFDAQPSANETNYHCISNPNELVVGYLSVGNVTTKRVFINVNQLLSTYSPKDINGCKIDTGYYYHEPYYFPPTVDLSNPNLGFTTIDGHYIAPLAPLGGPNFITYTTTVCDDCTLRGKLTPPPFWR